MNDSVLLTPWACCSAPRAVSTIAVRASPSMHAACMRFASDTPVIRSTRSGQYVETIARTEANPSVRASM